MLYVPPSHKRASEQIDFNWFRRIVHGHGFCGWSTLLLDNVSTTTAAVIQQFDDDDWFPNRPFSISLSPCSVGWLASTRVPTRRWCPWSLANLANAGCRWTPMMMMIMMASAMLAAVVVVDGKFLNLSPSTTITETEQQQQGKPQKMVVVRVHMAKGRQDEKDMSTFLMFTSLWPRPRPAHSSSRPILKKKPTRTITMQYGTRPTRLCVR